MSVLLLLLLRQLESLVPINCVFFALLHERSEQVLEAVDNVAFHFLRKGNVLVRHDGPKWYLTKQVVFDFFCKLISQFYI